MVKLLIEKGADIKAKSDSSGKTPLWEAVYTGNAETVKILLENGADIKEKNSKGWTLLHEAAKYNGDEKVVRILLENGADPHAKADESFSIVTLFKTPRDVVWSGSSGSYEGKKAIEKVLVEYMKRPATMRTVPNGMATTF